MKHFFWVLLFSIQFADAQKIKKADKAIMAGLEQHIKYLADDKLEGRRTGSAGEQLAYQYISKQFEDAGFQPKGTQGYLQPFEINDGREIKPVTHFTINDHELKLHEEFFPLSFSPNISLDASASLSLHENANPWFYDLKDLVESNKNNPHYDLQEGIKMMASDAAKKGANTLIIYNSSETDDALKFDPRYKGSQAAIPVLYISKTAQGKYLADETANLDLKLKIEIGDKKRAGHNVIAFVNKNATNTIIIGAHYDHLGYGEDKNSLFTGKEPAIHNGADDNASGTSAVIELGKMLKASRFKNNNYLLVAFSGEELGLFGSKYFTENPTIDLGTVNYMINMDMIGRLKDSTHGLNIGGYGTSPVWGELISKNDKYFQINLDSSGTGPSDHTSFYRKNIPVLFFFTGTHADYHKPGDDADKINLPGELQVVKYIYNLVERSDKKGKLLFAKTREVQMNSNTSFKVTLGIMPDYTFAGPGVRVDGVSEGRIAQKAGIKTGDIITALGENSFADVYGYTEVLKKFNKGNAAKVKVKRGIEDLEFDIVF